MFRTIFVALIALLSIEVYAVNAKSKLLIYSSAPDIYLCDAGIRHQKHQNRICFDYEAQQSCNPGKDCDGDVCACVCTAGADSDAGEYRLDFMKSSYAVYDGELDNSGTSFTSVKAIAGVNNYNRFFSGKDEWNRKLNSIEVFLSSERYGAEFYVDYCYRGSQIDWIEELSDCTGNDCPNNLAKAYATAKNVDNALNSISYLDRSALKARVDIVCDLAGVGADSVVEAGAVDVTPIIDNGLTVGDKFIRFPTDPTAFTNFSAANSYLVNSWINKFNPNAPLFCKFRFTFRETRRDSTDTSLQALLQHKRPNPLHAAEVCTYAEVNEDL